MPSIFDSLTQTDFGDRLEAVAVVPRPIGSVADLWHFTRERSRSGRWSWQRGPAAVVERVAAPASLVQSSVRDESGANGRLELVVPIEAPGGTMDLWHFRRDSSRRWHRGRDPVVLDVAGPASLIQSDFTDAGADGHLELVVPVAKPDGSADLCHFWRDSGGAWHAGDGVVASGVAGPGSLIQGTNVTGEGPHGNFEVVVPITGPGGGTDLWHFWRDGDFRWSASGIAVAGVSGPGSLIQSDFTDGGDGAGHLELVVPIDGSLVHHFRDSDGDWNPVRTITDAAGGWAALIRSSFGLGANRNFEVLVEECSSTIASYSRPNWDLGLPWLRGPVLRGEPAPRKLRGTAKVAQLTGDYDLEGWDGRDPAKRHMTRNQTGEQFGIRGTDLGSSFEHGGRTYFLFGDCARAAPTPGAEQADAIAWTADRAPVELGMPWEKGLKLHFQESPPLLRGVRQGGLEVPLDGFSHGGGMYVFFSSGYREVDGVGLMGFSVLARCVDPSAEGRLEFEPLQNPFSREKFVNVSVEVRTADAGEASELGLDPGRQLLWIWGSGRYRASNAYLAVAPLNGLSRGLEPRYFAGSAGWSTREEDARPLFSSGEVGELSVRWNPWLGRFLCLFNSGNPRGVMLHGAARPWGPWSQRPVAAFDPARDDGYGRFIHRESEPGKPPVDHNRDTLREGGIDVVGGEYGPYQVARYARPEGDGTVIYFTLSTWNPYQVMLMRTTILPWDLRTEGGSPAHPRFEGEERWKAIRVHDFLYPPGDAGRHVRRDEP